MTINELARSLGPNDPLLVNAELANATWDNGPRAVLDDAFATMSATFCAAVRRDLMRREALAALVSVAARGAILALAAVEVL